MTLVAVWPRVGASVPCPNSDSPPLASSGGTFTLTRYIRDLITDGDLCTTNPLGSPDQPEFDYFEDALYCTSLPDRVGDFGGQIVNCAGYASGYDGGEGRFYWDATSTDTANGGTIFGASGTGRWQRIEERERYINVKWFGAKGDNTTDDTAAIQAAFDAVGSFGWGGEVFFPPGVYKITSRLRTGWLLPDTFSANVKIRGSEAGGTSFAASELRWYGAATERWTPDPLHPETYTDYDSCMLQIGAADCIVEHLRFIVQPTHELGVMLNIGYFPSDPTTSALTNVTVKHCSMVAAKSPSGTCKSGIGFDYYNIATGNGENCSVYRCTIGGFTTACIYIRGGQPFNTVIDNCYIHNQGMHSTWTGIEPYGTGIKCDTVSASLHVTATSFHRLGAALNLVNYPSSTTLLNCEGEFNKKLFLHNGFGQGDLATVNFIGGRFAMDAVVYSSEGALTTFDPSDTDAIVMTGDANLTIRGVSFAAGPGGPSFYVNCRGNVISEGNVYLHATPFKRTAIWEADNAPRTFSHGDYYPISGSDNCALPTLNGFHAPGGELTFGAAVTAQSVVFANPEAATTPFGVPLGPNYRVQLTIQSATSGSTISTPYVSALDRLGFTVTLPSAPGVGKTIVVGYELVR